MTFGLFAALSSLSIGVNNASAQSFPGQDAGSEPATEAVPPPLESFRLRPGGSSSAGEASAPSANEPASSTSATRPSARNTAARPAARPAITGAMLRAVGTASRPSAQSSTGAGAARSPASGTARSSAAGASAFPYGANGASVFDQTAGLPDAGAAQDGLGSGAPLSPSTGIVAEPSKEGAGDFGVNDAAASFTQPLNFTSIPAWVYGLLTSFVVLLGLLAIRRRSAAKRSRLAEAEPQDANAELAENAADAPSDSAEHANAGGDAEVPYAEEHPADGADENSAEMLARKKITAAEEAQNAAGRERAANIAGRVKQQELAGSQPSPPPLLVNRGGRLREEENGADAGASSVDAAASETGGVDATGEAQSTAQSQVPAQFAAASGQSVNTSPEPAPAVSGNAANFSNGDLHIAFTGRRIERSLVNLTLFYQITLTNDGKTPAKDIVISGDFVGAHASRSAEDLLAGGGAKFAKLKQLDELGPGERTTWTGEIRLPINQADLLRKRAALFLVPLVRLSCQSGEDAPQLGCILLGLGGSDRGARLLPLRIDEGPRSFTPLASRLIGLSGVAEGKAASGQNGTKEGLAA